MLVNCNEIKVQIKRSSRGGIIRNTLCCCCSVQWFWCMLPIDKKSVTRKTPSIVDVLQYFVHSEMHSLYNVTTIVENPPYVFRIDCASKMGIAMMRTMLFVISLTGVLRNLQEIIPNEVFGPRNFPICTLLFNFGLCLGRHDVVYKLREVIF